MSWTAPRTWVTGEVVTSTHMNQHVRDNLNAILPVGSYIYKVGVESAVETVLENRFLECNGVAVSRATYADLNSLFSGLSYPFGSGNGSTTFNLPDFRGRVAVSKGGHADVNNLGDSEGLTDQTHRKPGHAHAIATQDTGASAQNSIGYGGNTLNQTMRYIRQDGTWSGTAPSNEPIGEPAYLVGGIWFIKYTS